MGKATYLVTWADMGKGLIEADNALEAMGKANALPRFYDKYICVGGARLATQREIDKAGDYGIVWLEAQASADRVISGKTSFVEEAMRILGG